MGMAAVLRTPRLVTYFVLTYAFSWAFWIPGALLFGPAVRAGSPLASPAFIVLTTIGAAGPSLVALVLARVWYGRDAVRSVLRRYASWRVSGWWYLAAAGLVPAIALAASALHGTLGDGTGLVSPTSVLARIVARMGMVPALAILPAILVSQLISSPLLEELGWRGFALPLLQRRHTALAAALVVGVVWAAWHLPLWSAYGGRIPVAMATLVTYSVLATWILNGAHGSMLLAVVFHASLNTAMNVISSRETALIELALAWIVVAAVVLRFGPRELAGAKRFAWQEGGPGGGAGAPPGGATLEDPGARSS